MAVGFSLTDGSKLSAESLNALVKATKGTGVGVGGKVEWSGSGDNCKIAPGMVISQGQVKGITSYTTLSVGTRHATLPKRCAILYDNSADGMAVLEGTAAAYPEVPALTDENDVLLGSVYLPVSGGAALTAGSFTDLRQFIDPAPFAHVMDDFAFDDTDLWDQTVTGSSTYAVGGGTVAALSSVAAASNVLSFLMGGGNLMASSSEYWVRVRCKCSLSSLSTALCYLGFYDSTGTPFSTSNNWVAVKFASTYRYASVGSGGSEAITSAGTLDTSYHTFDIVRQKLSTGSYGTAVMIDGSDTWVVNSTYNGPSTNLRFGMKCLGITSYLPVLSVDRVSVLYER